MLEHGGRLRLAASAYGIPLSDWLDLSTGINPHAWPVPALSAGAWHRLPEENDGLEAAAAAYYGNPKLLVVAGSQAAIQLLPSLFPKASVACVAPLYAEHPRAWHFHGHVVESLPTTLDVAERASHTLLCNPNNPTAQLQRPEALLEKAEALAKRGGWLIVDEAFIDTTPEFSLTHLAGTSSAPNLIVLRSLGKFFGLAGARVGFVFAATGLLEQLAEKLGPWTVSGPSREAACQALQDTEWQKAMRERLASESRCLHEILLPLGGVASTPLFSTVTSSESGTIHRKLAQQGILTRHFPEHDLLRFGLPGNELAWQRLATALRNCSVLRNGMSR